MSKLKLSKKLKKAIKDFGGKRCLRYLKFFQKNADARHQSERKAGNSARAALFLCHSGIRAGTPRTTDG